MKQAFVFLNLLLLTLGAFLTVQNLYSGIDLAGIEPAERDAPRRLNEDRADPARAGASSGARYQDIITRNIFNVKTVPEKETAGNDPLPEPPAEKPVETLAPTTLALKLWGTVTGGPQPYAVVEDTKIRQQALYQKGDVIQQAVVKEILVHRVVLTLNGQDQVLDMELMQAGETIIPRPAADADSETITIGRDLIDKTLEDIQGVMKNVRIRPHFADGRADGLLIYGIRPGSVFADMGLKNGDIVREVNGTPTVVEEDALKIYEDLENASSARVVISRRGARKELIYHVDRGAYSITTFPE